MTKSNRVPAAPRVMVIMAAIAALLTGFAVSLWWATPPPQPPQLSRGTLLPQPQPLPAMQLIDNQGRKFTVDRLKNHWNLLFFGYTHCPDVCPTTMTVLQQMVRQLEAIPLSGDTIQVVFISVDPVRDTPEQLDRFVPYFNRDFIGVTGTPRAIDNLTRVLGIMHSTPAATPDDFYTVDHSASILLVDPEARFYGVFSPPHQAENLAADLKRIVRFYELNE